MRAYKLLRKLSDGNLYPLFIHKTYSTPINEWMQAECYPTKGDVAGIVALDHLLLIYQ